MRPFKDKIIVPEKPKETYIEIRIYAIGSIKPYVMRLVTQLEKKKLSNIINKIKKKTGWFEYESLHIKTSIIEGFSCYKRTLQ